MANFEFWALLVAKKGYNYWSQAGYPRTFKNKPPAGRNSIPIKIKIDVPDAYFEEPQLTFCAAIPERDEPPRVDAEVVSGIQMAIEKDLGVKVHLTSDIPEPEAN